MAAVQWPAHPEASCAVSAPLFLYASVPRTSENIMASQDPYSSSPYEQWDKLVLDLEGHDLIRTSNELLPYEYSRYTGLAPHLLQCPFNLLPVLNFVELVNCRICPKATDESLDGMAHATTAPAKDHHRPVCNHPCNHFHRYAAEKTSTWSNMKVL
ncbi:hypothetical protein QQP08_000131 [Theobroma cacao]|nr:hypothetical protein QQP08_000131 [Theobroma cacao]